jgi:8-amino-7-oxononanoate synthase
VLPIYYFHQTETALIFQFSDATIGFFLVQFLKRDLILYDELCSASIRDGIQLSNAKACKFNHNDFEDLERLIQNPRPKTQDPSKNLHCHRICFFLWMAIVLIWKN